jgi:predicted metal-binding protein
MLKEYFRGSTGRCAILHAASGENGRFETMREIILTFTCSDTPPKLSIFQP